MTSTLRFLRSVVLNVGAILGAICLLWTLCISIAGVTPLVVLSGSMAPALEAGDVAFVRSTPADEIEIGDIVSVVDAEGTRITHRVDAVRSADEGHKTLSLKGDSNEAADAETYTVAVVDRVVGEARGVGFILSGAATPWGIGAGVALLLGCLAVGWRELRTRADSDLEAPRPRRPQQALSDHRSRHVAALALVLVVLVGVGSASAPQHSLAYFTDKPTVVSSTNALDSAPWFTCNQAMTSTELSAFAYYRFNDAASATTVADVSGNNRTMTMGGTYTFNQTQGCGRDRDTGARISGGYGASPEIFGASGSAGARWNTFTISLWFRGEIGSVQGHLIGMNSVADGSSGTGDRRIYVDPTGRLHFGVNGSSVQTIATPASGAPGYIDFRENRWHMVTASLSASGLKLYVDGELVPATTTEQGAASSSVTAGSQVYSTAYWTVGAGPTASTWPGALSSGSWKGPVNKVGIWAKALTDQQVRDLYRAGSPVAVPSNPTSSFSLTSSTVAPGGTLRANYTTELPDALNWIAVYPVAQQKPGSGPFSIVWRYAAGASGAVQMPAPSTPGTYALWYLAKDAYQPLTTNLTFTVQ